MLELLIILLKVFIVFGGVMTAIAYLIVLERRMAAWVQDRHGPNRVGIPLTNIHLFGLGQPIADGVKFLFKEGFIPGHVDKIPFLVAPVVFFASAIASYAVIPFGGILDLSSLGIDYKIPLTVAYGCDVGVIYLFALSGLAVYGVIIGGWASNSKYSLLGGLRSSAALIAYEIPMGLAILGVVLAVGSLNLDVIAAHQSASGLWFVFLQPLGFLVFVIASLAESARLPFDLPECEQELVGGYHTEYTGMKLAAFLAAEFIHMVTASFLIVVMFLGGWHFWGLPTGANEIVTPFEFVLRFSILCGKSLAVIVLFMLIRWSWPRFRFDQLMDIAWKVMLPLGMLNLLAVAILGEVDLASGRWIGEGASRVFQSAGWFNPLSVAVGLVVLVASVCTATLWSAREKPAPAGSIPGTLHD